MRIGYSVVTINNECLFMKTDTLERSYADGVFMLNRICSDLLRASAHESEVCAFELFRSWLRLQGRAEQNSIGVSGVWKRRACVGSAMDGIHFDALRTPFQFREALECLENLRKLEFFTFFS